MDTNFLTIYKKPIVGLELENGKELVYCLGMGEFLVVCFWVTIVLLIYLVCSDDDNWSFGTSTEVDWTRASSWDKVRSGPGIPGGKKMIMARDKFYVKEGDTLYTYTIKGNEQRLKSVRTLISS